MPLAINVPLRFRRRNKRPYWHLLLVIRTPSSGAIAGIFVANLAGQPRTAQFWCSLTDPFIALQKVNYLPDLLFVSHGTENLWFSVATSSPLGSAMANIVICADGTWNRPESDLRKDFPTNVLKLARAIKPRAGSLKQHVFYDWGLGSYHDSVSAGVARQGIHKNILDGYRYIVQNFAQGDKIYLFGFSRGAYTVRALSGLINNCGILERADARLINEAWKIYKNPAKKNMPQGPDATAFRTNHCYRFRKIHFVGAWDTVGALGIPFSFMGLFQRDDEFYDTKMGANIVIARHALSIDEQREDFAPTIWQPRKGVDLKQVWFAGAHSDVGGSYPPDKETHLVAADVPLEWMANEASGSGLSIEPHLFATLTDGQMARLQKSRNHVFRFKKPLHRCLERADIPLGIHPSVKERYRHDASYRPPQLKKLVEEKGWNALDVQA